MVTRDGTSFTVTNGTVTAIRDRNGNVTSLASGAITDSLNRTYQTGNAITYAGAGGTPRTITILHASLDSVLAPGESIQTYGQLWPSLPSSTTDGSDQYNLNDRVKEIDLPDGTKYQFTYHSYGDVAQITLPTGGIIQYQLALGINCSQSITRGGGVSTRRDKSERKEHL